MRQKRVRLSEDEHEMLVDYRDDNYPGTPLGSVIKILIDKND